MFSEGGRNIFDGEVGVGGGWRRRDGCTAEDFVGRLFLEARIGEDLGESLGIGEGVGIPVG